MVQPNFRVKKGNIKIGCYVSIIIQLKEERDEYEEVVSTTKGCTKNYIRIPHFGVRYP